MDEQQTGEFAVFQFFPNGEHEEVVGGVDARTAMRTAVGLIESIGGLIGTTERVIITDGDDFINFEWIHGRGCVYPPHPTPSATP
jgi:hypothetical protein